MLHLRVEIGRSADDRILADLVGRVGEKVARRRRLAGVGKAIPVEIFLQRIGDVSAAGN